MNEIVAVARPAPGRKFARTRFEMADIATDDLVPLLRGADAVVHLAWLIQPGRTESITHRVNVAGSERLLHNVTEAAVPALVYASSVGAYLAGTEGSPGRRIVADQPDSELVLFPAQGRG